ncbi:phospholipase/carboxylesterase [Azoarcus sp. CIB]|uniref:esterase n=1 Tax=Aromatoleum sp. (strain CIB) TaxID=198107 RepID=UPI00067BE509|nr:esterase [Azoarcus sp. CIB]AKU11181.1 phospholipase/carboxylesterase [Azoarcus sp. CIB]
MTDDTIHVQQPAAARRLVLLLHGVGATPQNLLPLAEAIAHADPAAWVVSVRSPDPCDFGIGWQWFPVRGVTEENRLERVAAAIPQFIDTVRDWQRQSGVGPDATTLVGFSQGAIMALESTQIADRLAAQVIAIAGRFAQPPRICPAATAVHLIHGNDDSVIDPRYSIAAADRLASMGAEVTLNQLASVGHTIDERVIERVCAQLRHA